MISVHRAPPMVIRVLHELEQAGIVHCVLRGGDRIAEEGDDDEVDLLVRSNQLRDVNRVLVRLGFVRLRTWGHAPHHFFVTYNEAADRWLKFDVVTEIAYGRPTHELSTRLAEACLEHRQQIGTIFVPAPEDELVALLLHCVVDKGVFPQTWRRRIGELCEQVQDASYVTNLLAEYWTPPLTFARLAELVRTEQWQWLVDQRSSVERGLRARNRLGKTAIRVRDQVLRKLNHLAGALRPRPLAVAILAPDGAGKSTVASELSHHFFFPVDQIYMGLYQQRPVAKRLELPGLGLAGKILTQWQRYLRGYAKRARGRFVIFDRYTYDALLPSRTRLTRLQKLRRWVLAHSCPAPDLILVLDAPGEVLYARKGEHSPEYLESHRQAYLQLRHKFPEMVIVDAAQDAAEVRRAVTRHIWHGFAGRLHPAGQD